MKKAVVLLSGGLDSTTCLALAIKQGYQCYAISFDYGQRHNRELASAKNIASHFNVAAHHIYPLAIDAFGGSALTDTRIDVPDFDGTEGIPVTYVPARNTMFLSIALGFAEVVDADAIFIGVSSVDYSGYPDCRPAFIEAYERLANLATKKGVEGEGFRLHAPLLHLSKAQTIQLGLRLGVDYAMTVSCYQLTSQGLACGRCDSCVLRQQGFIDAGVNDPTRYSLASA